MADGICIFAEYYDGKLEPVTAELVSAAKVIRESTGEKIKAVIAAVNLEPLVAQLRKLDIDEIYAVKMEEDCMFQDDTVSTVITDMLKKIEPTSVLVPATMIGRSIFSRVAAKLGCGLTADCTELKVDKREDGSFYVKQNKPSYGENVFVTIITKEGVYPQMMTVRPGVYTPCEEKAQNQAEVIYMEDIKIPKSKVKVLEVLKGTDDTDNILSSDVVVVAGRGALDDGNYELLQKFAQKIGGAVGGTRPIADTGLIPFDHQIGQTGFTIRPKICISLGVSGAIQHTEGIKDTKLYIAINNDEGAPVFNTTDYGMVTDMKEVLEKYLELN